VQKKESSAIHILYADFIRIYSITAIVILHVAMDCTTVNLGSGQVTPACISPSRPIPVLESQCLLYHNTLSAQSLEELLYLRK